MHFRAPSVSAMLCLCTLILVAGCGGAQSRFASHMRRGEGYFQKGDFTRASVEFRNALQIQPKDPHARVLAGKTAEHLGRYRDAVGFYRSALDLTPDDIDARVQLGRLMVLGGQLQDAEEVIRPGLERHPASAPLLATRAALRLTRQDLDGAAADADQAIRLDPSNEEAVALRAGLYRHAGDSAKALLLVSDAIKRIPQSIDLRQVLADLYAAAGDRTHAEEQYRAMIALKPREPTYRYELAKYLGSDNRTAEAQRVLEDAVKELPDNNDVKLTLVSFISTHEGRKPAEARLRGFIDSAPSNAGLRLGLGDLLLRFGAPDEAASVYSDVAKSDRTGQDGVTAREHLAGVALAKGHWSESRRLLDEVLKTSPRDSDALVLRSELELAQSNATAAIADLRAALRDKPEAIGLRRVLARAYVANGDDALAEETLRVAMQQAPGDLEVRKELVQVLVRAHRPEQAVALLEEAARAHPNDPAVYQALARTYLDVGDYARARTAADQLKVTRAGSAFGPYIAALAAAGQGQTELAEHEFDRALAIEPSNFEILSARVDFERSHGRLEQAVSAVSTQSGREPKNPLLLNLLGELHTAQGKSDVAQQEFASAVTLAPQWWLPYFNLAQAKAGVGDFAGAVAVYDTGLKSIPSEGRLAIGRAQVLERQGRVDQALASYDQFHAANPTELFVTNNLAMLLINYRGDRGSLDRARALTADFAGSNDATLLDTLGWLRFKRAEYSEAFAVLKQASERRPESREIRYHLGLAELHTGHVSEARAELERALAGSASFAGADDARAVLASLKVGAN